jgi:mannobiose 2-epimerase
MDTNHRPATRAELPTAEQLESWLHTHVVEAWFPRSLDEQYGGFLCDFDRAWRPRGEQRKLLEFQARHTLFAAEASQAYPADERLRRAAWHGFRQLRDAQWDHDTGGWYHSLDRAGAPEHAHTKHAHGTAYAIEACVAVHQALGVPEALDLALAGFHWLDDHGHDPEHGGYLGFFKRDGSVIREPAECPWPARADNLNTPIGLKDTNVHSDLLETFAYLARASRDRRVHERLAEMAEIVADKLGLHFYFEADWTPVPHLAHYGYCLQNSFRLGLASGVLGCADRLRPKVLRALDQALAQAWDRRRGGLFYGGPGCTPLRLDGMNLLVRRKAWWVQFEGLKALTAAIAIDPENQRYRDFLAALWAYVEANLFDRTHGGIFTEATDALPSWRRAMGRPFAPGKVNAKGSIWKDASHDGRAIMYCLANLQSKSLTKSSSGQRQSAREFGLVA